MELSRLMAPFTPFITEAMYQHLIGFCAPGSGSADAAAAATAPGTAKSIHFTSIPEVQPHLVDAAMEARTQLMQTVIELGRTARERRTLSLKNPVREVIVIHPDARVLCNDCNLLLDVRLHPWKAGALAHGNFAARGLPAVAPDALLLPPKGETQLLVGGPPCQGFSGMNRFNVSDHSKAKNSHVVPYLSYLDFYRPRFFILENVPNVMQHPSAKPHHVVRMILRSVLEMGYQARVAVLQAGHHGVAQSRVRLIVIAAAPGLALPEYPAPVHTFEARRYAFPLNVAVGRWPRNAAGELAMGNSRFDLQALLAELR
jgi:hypothetical protein